MRGIISPLAGLRFHDLRHSAATKMLENGVPHPTVAQVMGGQPLTTIRMAKSYGHIRPEAQRQALGVNRHGATGGHSCRKKNPFFGDDVHQKLHQAPKPIS